MQQLHQIEVTETDIKRTAQWAHESGIQPWSYDPVAATRLRIYNERANAADPGYASKAREFGTFEPVRQIPLDAEGRLHAKDLPPLLAWLQGHQANGVARVRLCDTRTQSVAAYPTDFVLAALGAAERVGEAFVAG